MREPISGVLWLVIVESRKVPFISPTRTFARSVATIFRKNGEKCRVVKVGYMELPQKA